MNWITKIIIYLNPEKIGTKDVNRWVQEGNIDLLKLILKKGLYPERIQAINGLEQLKEKSIIPELIKIGKHDFEVVAKVAINAIKKLDIDSNLTIEIEHLEKFWEWKNKKTPRSPNTKWLNKKEKMQMLEKVRKQLRRPMR
ncbi:MAG: hypothetical protein AB8F94_10765 [Saprospiraceae bacterium]